MNNKLILLNDDITPNRSSEVVLLEYIRNRWPENEFYRDLCDVLAALHGYKLHKGDTFTWHFANKEYKIIRTK